MTDHQFKNGIVIHIPDSLPNPIEEWTAVKVAMSLMIDPPPATEEIKKRKPYPMSSWTAKRKRQTGRAVKAWHRMKNKKK